MNIKDFAWNYFNKSGSVEAYLLYRQGVNTAGEERKTGVCEHKGCGDKRNEAGRQ